MTTDREGQERDDQWIRAEGLEDVDRDLRRATAARPPDDFAAGVMARVALTGRRRRGSWAVMAAAAMVVCTLGGVWAGRLSAASPRPTHMLVIQERLADRLSVPEDERQRRGREFGAWVGSLAARNLLAGGQQLGADGGRLVAAAGIDDRSAGVPDGETMTGILLVRASSYDEATAAAAACPILGYGGTVLVRQIR